MNTYELPLLAKVLDMDADKPIILLNEITSKKLDAPTLSRVRIKNPSNQKVMTAIVNTTETIVKPKQIGLFGSVGKRLNSKTGDKLFITVAEQPKSIDAIKRKLVGETLSDEEIGQIIYDISTNNLSEVEITYFVAGVYNHGFTDDEIVSMVKHMVESGESLGLGHRKILDKHSIGGVAGNRTSPLVVSIVTSLGYIMPKTSSRAITSAAGTADTLEVLMPVEHNIAEIKRIVDETGGALIWGGSVNLAPADDKIIKVEHPLSLDPQGQLVSSVLAKKLAVGATYAVIDIPMGPHVKVKNMDEAKELARKFVEVGAKVGIIVNVLITDGDQPVGRVAGPALESKYVLEILEGKRFEDLADKSCLLAGKLLEMAGHCSKGEGYEIAKKTIENKKALTQFRRIIKAQGGNPDIKSEDIPVGKQRYEFRSEKNGTVAIINNRTVNKIARIAGSPITKGAGIQLYVMNGSRVKKGQILFEIFAENEAKLFDAQNFAKANNPVEIEKMIIEEYTGRDFEITPMKV
ncbi:MAG: AMP phosphorylase [Candidatus Diapherotrites archaeon]|nr:AMP phosphorylase [Candidatus Diapherotrites archaeon]